jgi:polyisoprenoid-binding protein YceI
MSTTTAPAQTVTSWSVDPSHSHVEFAVKHLMIATVKGRFGVVRGTVTIDETDPARGAAEIEIDADSIDTGQAQRDAHLRSADFFDVETFPKLIFRSTRIAEVSDDRFTLTGDLTIHGVTRQVSLDVRPEGRGKDPWGGERSGFSATTTIKRSDFGLTWNQLLETGGLAVGDEIRISLDLEVVKQSANS